MLLWKSNNGPQYTPEMKKNGEGNKARKRTTHGHYQFRLNNASQVESVLIQRALSSEIEASDTFLCGLSERFTAHNQSIQQIWKASFQKYVTGHWNEKRERQKDIVLKSIFQSLAYNWTLGFDGSAFEIGNWFSVNQLRGICTAPLSPLILQAGLPSSLTCLIKAFEYFANSKGLGILGPEQFCLNFCCCASCSPQDWVKNTPVKAGCSSGEVVCVGQAALWKVTTCNKWITFWYIKCDTCELIADTNLIYIKLRVICHFKLPMKKLFWFMIHFKWGTLSRHDSVVEWKYQGMFGYSCSVVISYDHRDSMFLLIFLSA